MSRSFLLKSVVTKNDESFVFMDYSHDKKEHIILRMKDMALYQLGEEFNIKAIEYKDYSTIYRATTPEDNSQVLIFTLEDDRYFKIADRDLTNEEYIEIRREEDNKLL